MQRSRVGDLFGSEFGQQFVSDRPRRRRRVPADGVQADTEAHLAPALLGELADLLDLGRRGRRRLTPRQVYVDVLRSDRQRGG